MSKVFSEGEKFRSIRSSDVIVEAICYSCGHFLANKRCLAFLDGIPAGILDMSHDHRLPYPGDDGIIYKLRGL